MQEASMAKPLSAARYSFGAKILVGIVLAAIANVLLFDKLFGSTVGLFALCWVMGLAAAQPQSRSRLPALGALGIALAMALVLVDDPGILSWLLFWASLSSAALLARVPSRHALELSVRLVIQTIVGLGAPLRDVNRLLRLPRVRLRNSVLAMAAALGLPLAGGAIFLALFASANPIIENLLPSLPSFDDTWIPRAFFSVLVFALAWPSLRPAHAAIRWQLYEADRPLVLPGVTILSITISLILFNAIFAVENLLDIAFLWSGAPLPGDMTMAQYAHRGAYPLIATALLAGAFDLFTARPDTEIGRNRTIRKLVVLWIAQNLILVASSVIRTVDYIDVYMLTGLRIAALVWMGLVAVGLALICWRMVAGRSLAWLINRTAAAAILVLIFSSVVDFGTLAADWNLRHAREAGGTGQALDLYYIAGLGPSALVPLAEADTRPLDAKFLNRLAGVRASIVDAMEKRQQAPYGWTWRNARRLARVAALHPRAYALASYDIFSGQPVALPAATLTAPAGR
jgi:hypothetical protein